MILFLFSSISTASPFYLVCSLKSHLPLFPRCEYESLPQLASQNLPVTDLSRSRTVGNYLNDLRCFVVGDENLKLHLRQEIHRVLSATIELGMSLLATESL